MCRGSRRNQESNNEYTKYHYTLHLSRYYCHNHRYLEKRQKIIASLSRHKLCYKITVFKSIKTSLLILAPSISQSSEGKRNVFSTL